LSGLTYFEIAQTKKHIIPLNTRPYKLTTIVTPYIERSKIVTFFFTIG